MTDTQSETPAGNCTEISIRRLPTFSQNVRSNPKTPRETTILCFAVPSSDVSDSFLRWSRIHRFVPFRGFVPFARNRILSFLLMIRILGVVPD
ncbi:hypothetical protein AVEN_198594-1 [Araneus ventricosus]|uniref:Uncharacterized protein n=1 Tax=Araneus ventricosus TaxID=182803 RepID=A0A4Y2TZ35_ARAVE|nr:hypothetical protein AVEN_198594-1 [Araneus ventricosus]